MNAPIDQFGYDLGEWMRHRGANIVCSWKLIAHCQPHLFTYWKAWLAGQRAVDGLPPHAVPPRDAA